MLSNERLAQLVQDCSACAYDLYDSSVTAEQDEHGRLTFQVIDEDGDSGSRVFLVPFGNDLRGGELWKAMEEGVEYDGVSEPIINLVPKLIVALLGT
jgi:hypothetical protein